MIVLDCNAASAIARDTLEGQTFRAYMEQGDKVVAPRFFQVESGNVVWKYVRAGNLLREEAKPMFERYVSLVDRFFPDEDLIVEAMHESIRLDYSVYDMLYFVLARRSGSILITLDRKLQLLCMRHGVDCGACIQDL